jgi:hemerythrin
MQLAYNALSYFQKQHIRIRESTQDVEVELAKDASFRQFRIYICSWLMLHYKGVDSTLLYLIN